MCSKTKLKLSEKIAEKLYHVEYQRNNGSGLKSFVFSHMKHNKEFLVSVFRNPCFPKANVTIEGFSDVAIVFQGPVSKEYDFTINTIRFFREIYPEIYLILSTWKNELNDSDKRILEKCNCKLIESDGYPSVDKGNGQKKSHLRNQLFSTLQGIKYAQNCGCKYILKIRTDLRINKQDIMPYFMNLLRFFPCENKSQSNRLICVSFSNNLVNVPFHMSDFIWFGHLNDMEKMYSIPYWSDDDLNYIRLKTASSDFMKKHATMFTALRFRDYWDNPPPRENDSRFDEHFLLLFHEEVYIAYNAAVAFSVVNGKKTLEENYRNFIKDSLIVIDDRNIDVYWNKNNHNLLEKGRIESDCGKLTASVWFDLYCKRNKNV